MVKYGWVSKVIYLIVILGSISVCFWGVRANLNQEQYRKKEYAKLTVKNEAVKVKRLNKEIGQLYQNEQEEFLTEPVDDEKLKTIEREILVLKTEAADFDLKNEDFNINTLEVTQGKIELLAKIEDIKNKRNTQKQVAALLEHAPTDWTVTSDSILINNKATTEGISQIQNEVSKTNSQWSNAIIAYLNEMDAQIKQYNEIDQSIAGMIQDGALTSNANLDNFILAFNQLDQVKNEQLRKTLLDKLDEIDKLLESQANGGAVSGQEDLVSE